VIGASACRVDAAAAAASAYGVAIGVTSEILRPETIPTSFRKCAIARSTSTGVTREACMLRIAKSMGRPSDVTAYLMPGEGEHSRADYYARNEGVGRWGGRLAERLGLAGEVGRAQFEALANNCKRRPARRRAFGPARRRAVGHGGTPTRDRPAPRRKRSRGRSGGPYRRRPSDAGSPARRRRGSRSTRRSTGQTPLVNRSRR